jgi:hypothetical protein
VLLVVVSLLHLALVCAQPVLAGWSLDGAGVAIDLHGTNASILLTVSLLLIPLGVLWWRRGRRTVWAPLLATSLFIAEFFQLQLGYAGVLVAHVPLGVAIVIGSLVLVAMVLRRPSSEPGRRRPAVP